MDTTSEIRCSASWSMVRNLRIGKGTPLRPARGWMKSTGPRESSLIITATTAMTGVSTTRPAVATTTSSVRLSAIVDREGLPVRYSITGSSAMWLSSTAVPSIARIGGATLSFTPSERQLRTTRASVGSSSSGAARMTRSAWVALISSSRSAWSRSSSCAETATSSRMTVWPLLPVAAGSEPFPLRPDGEPV